MAGAKHKRNERGITILANNIRKYRKAADLTIQQLADQLNIDYSQISRMERGTINPSISVVFDIADILKISASKLLEEDLIDTEE